MNRLMLGFLAVALTSICLYGDFHLTKSLYGFQSGDCLIGPSSYTYKVMAFGKYSIKAVRAVEYSDHDVYEFVILNKKDLKDSYLMDCFETFDEFNKQGERK